MKLIAILSILGLVVLGHAIITPEKAEKNVRDLIEMKTNLNKVYKASIFNNKTEDVKKAKELIKLVTVYYTRFVFRNGTEYLSIVDYGTIYDMMFGFLKTTVEKFVEKRENYFDIDKLQLNKQDNYEYDMNLLRVLLDRIMNDIKNKIEQSENGNTKYLKEDQEKIKDMQLLVDTVLISDRLFTPINKCNQEFVRRKSIELIKNCTDKYNLKDVVEIDEFEKRNANDTKTDDELNEITSVLYELNILTARTRLIMSDFSIRGLKVHDVFKFKDEIYKFNLDLNDVKKKLKDLIVQEKRILEGYANATNSAETIISMRN